MLTKSGRIQSAYRKHSIRSASASVIGKVIGSYCLLSQPLQLFVIDAGATDFYIGLINSSIWLGSPFFVMGIYVMYRLGKRKALLYCSGVVSSILALPIVFAPLIHHYKLMPDSTMLYVVFSAAVLHSIFESLGGASWFPMLQDNVPRRAAGKFFGLFRRRWQIALMIGTFLISFFLGEEPEWWRFFAVFAVGELFFLSKIISLSGIAEKPLSEENKNISPLRTVISVLKNKPVRDLCIYICIYNIAAYMPFAFFVKFLKTEGALSGSIIAATAMVPLGAIISLKFWGIVCDKYGNRSVFTFSHIGMIITLLLWCFISTGIISKIMFFILFCTWSIFQAGNGVAQTRHMFYVTPQHNQAQISILNLIFSLSIALGSLLGGLFLSGLTNIFPGLESTSMSYRLLFAFSAILCIVPHLLLGSVSLEQDWRGRKVFVMLIASMKATIGSFVITKSNEDQ
ncbi:MFS transporter [Sedimentisphaera salicampi]|uniref:Arabinose efflux permease n=1 Tax=Sedimentisphaera salicampi TaxID=1941349 RepID=A0A1W6LJM5_9BACT|nr:MFS transporter [Sedimentisphaera salicampi]ARN55943.1 Arabinose efflux permease [Sedimentisphaera salicampi]